MYQKGLLNAIEALKKNYFLTITKKITGKSYKYSVLILIKEDSFNQNHPRLKPHCLIKCLLLDFNIILCVDIISMKL